MAHHAPILVACLGGICYGFAVWLPLMTRTSGQSRKQAPAEWLAIWVALVIAITCTVTVISSVPALTV